jgi:hypothetical protein
MKNNNRIFPAIAVIERKEEKQGLLHFFIPCSSVRYSLPSLIFAPD